MQILILTNTELEICRGAKEIFGSYNTENYSKIFL